MVELLMKELTVRQQQVLELLIEGLESRQVAEVLGTSMRTVHTHRAAILHRLGAHTMVEAAVRYVRHADLARFSIKTEDGAFDVEITYEQDGERRRFIAQEVSA